MGVLNLRGIPDELIRRMKMRAAENGVTLKDECLEIIRRHCGIVGTNDGDQEADREGKPGGGRSEASSVPVLPQTSQPEKRLRKVPAVRDQLASGGGSEQASAGEQRAVSVKCEKPGHFPYFNAGKWGCVNCDKESE